MAARRERWGRILSEAEAAGLPIAAAVEARFGQQPPSDTFHYGQDWIEVWDADDFDPWSTLGWPTVRVMRYRQHKKNGTIIQAGWLTNFSIAMLGARSFFKLAKSRWEIENQGFNDGKNLFGMEHIQHHHPNIANASTASDTCIAAPILFSLPCNSRTRFGCISGPPAQTPVDHRRGHCSGPHRSLTT
jgi:hypothetical protein